MIVITLIANMMLVLGGLWLPQTQATADVETRQPIRVIADSYSIDYPDGITLTIEAESESPIIEVVLYYRVGPPGNPVVYGYPSFTTSDWTTARFSIKTSGASYVPPGASIEYHFELVDEDGNRTETERRAIEYLDPAYEWRRYEQGDLIVLYHDRSEEAVARVAAVVVEKAREVKSLLGLESVPPQKAVIFNGPLESRRAFPTVSGTATERHVFGGFAFGEYDLFLLEGLGPNGMVHELTHLLIDEAMQSPLSRVPAWLNEGLAMHFEPTSPTRQGTVIEAARQGKLLPVHGMNTVPGRPEDVGLFYAQARSLVDFVMRAYGPERMSALLDALADGRSIEAAVREAYGASLGEVEQEWKSDLAQSSQGHLPFDPGTLGTSAIIGGAVAITVVMVIFRWLRQLVGAAGNAEDADASSLSP